MSVLGKFYGNAIVLAAAYGRKGIAYRDPEMLRRDRDRRLRRLVRHAADCVPYYRDWFREHRIDPRDLRTADDLAELPLLEKARVREDPERFRATTRSGRQALRFNTSGSTGSPLTVYHDRRSILANMAFGEPASAAMAEILGRRFGYKVLRVNRAASIGRRVRGFYDANSLIPLRPRDNVLDVTEPPEAVVDRIRQLEPDVLKGYGSYMEMFFRFLYEQRVEIPLPRVVGFAADGMTAPGRRLITGHFGIPVLGSYAAVECFKIGFQCGQGEAYHLHEDLCHVRITDQGGDTVASGRSGSVVISNLVNRGTVLLNYRLGDIATLADRQCACGRSLRLLTSLDGRSEDMLVLGDGRPLHPRAIWGVLSTTEGLLRYQLLQHELDRFELKLVAGNDAAYARIIERAEPGLREILGASAHIDFRRQEVILPDASGKFRPVISKLGKAGAS